MNIIINDSQFVITFNLFKYYFEYKSYNKQYTEVFTLGTTYIEFYKVNNKNKVEDIIFVSSAYDELFLSLCNWKYQVTLFLNKKDDQDIEYIYGKDFLNDRLFWNLFFTKREINEY